MTLRRTATDASGRSLNFNDLAGPPLLSGPGLTVGYCDASSCTITPTCDVIDLPGDMRSNRLIDFDDLDVHKVLPERGGIGMIDVREAAIQRMTSESRHADDDLLRLPVGRLRGATRDEAVVWDVAFGDRHILGHTTFLEDRYAHSP